MDKRDFLEHVTAKQGYYCIVGIKKGVLSPSFFQDVDAAVSHADKLLAREEDVYFGVARYQTNENRLAINAKYFKSFWVDVDCGPTKDYPDQKQGYNAIMSFCEGVNLPYPTIINSGNGWHCYWTLTEEISYNDWKPFADHLKSVCLSVGFKIDAGITGDAARILRLPQTKNYKSPSNPKDVGLALLSESNSFSSLKRCLDFTGGTAVYSFGDPTGDDPTDKLAFGEKANFAKIMRMSVKGHGCNQLAHAYTHQNDMSEPMWRDALSVAQFCEDRDKAIHLMSRQYEHYDPYEVEAKANKIKGGAHRCVTFQSSFGAERCDTCVHKGKLNSPIRLGMYVPEATPEDNIVVARHKGLNEDTTFIIPTYPKPYFRGKNGGVYMKKNTPLAKNGETDADLETDILIYENDLFVEKRLRDEEVGEMALIKLHLPRDGVEEFVAPLQDILSRDKARVILASKGVAAMDKKMTNIMEYLANYVHHLQKTEEAEIARAQFGWHDDDECFVIGTREISIEGVRYSPPSSSTQEIADKFRPAGELSEWVRIANLYGKKGNEARAFALGVGFGAPLVRFSGIKGFLVHLTNERSGVGKTTIQHMIGSIWGHPECNMMSFDDKFLARQMFMGVLKNMPMCVDEITDLPPAEIGTIAYMITQGKGRDRMQAQVNALRKNRTTWELPCITSGNNSLYDVLLSHKALPEGEMMRVLELYIQPDDSMTKEETDHIYTDVLRFNYGFAGEAIVKYILSNREECTELYKETRVRFDAKAKFSQKHRFYSAACAVSITGLEIAKRCGMHNIDIESIENWAAATIGNASSVLNEEKDTSLSILGDFLNIYNGQIFVGYQGQVNGLDKHPTFIPSREVVARYDQDVRLVSISSSVLRRWCADKQIPFKGFIDSAKKKGIYSGSSVYRLAYGPNCPGTKVRTEQFYIDDMPSQVGDVELV